jgi:hypothetical protein
VQTIPDTREKKRKNAWQKKKRKNAWKNAWQRVRALRAVIYDNKKVNNIVAGTKQYKNK